uniref:Uncharacterized protein n=1 Tax=Glossina pallidipes TaxID=7398 RepID=A0A1A9Z388_GLOPL
MFFQTPPGSLSSKRRNKNELFPAEPVQVTRLSVYCVDDGQSVSLTTFVIISKASARHVLHSFQPTIRRHLSLNLTKSLKLYTYTYTYAHVSQHSVFSVAYSFSFNGRLPQRHGKALYAHS